MKIPHGRALLLPVMALLSSPASSQELTLFQDDALRGAFAQGGPPAAVRAQAAPEVVLKGIYRLGDTYHLSLQSGVGGAVHRVTWRPSQGSPPVFNGYQIQSVDSRNVTLGLPAGVSCQTNVQSGGTCLGRNQMSLTFAQADAAPARRSADQGNASDPRSGNDNGPLGQRNDDERWNAEMSNGDDIRTLTDAARGEPPDADRQAIEAAMRGRFGGRGNNSGNPGGRGGRGGFNAGNNGGGFPAGNDDGFPGGGDTAGGGRGGNGQ